MCYFCFILFRDFVSRNATARKLISKPVGQLLQEEMEIFVTERKALTVRSRGSDVFCWTPVISLLFINRVLKATNNKFGEIKFASCA